MDNLYKSNFESDFLELNIYRNAKVEPIGFSSLNNFIAENEVDVIRLKTDINQQQFFNSHISKLSMPIFFSHTILYVYADYSKEKINSYNNSDLSFEKYNANNLEQKKRFYELVYKGMFQEPIGYFKTPILSELISNEKEASCYASYYAEFYGGSDVNKIGFIMQKNGIDAAVFVFELLNNEMHTSMAAILPEFRSVGIFHDLKVFRQEFCLQNAISYAYTGFRVNNFHTPNVLLKHGYKIINAENVFHLLPFSSHSNKTFKIFIENPNHDINSLLKSIKSCLTDEVKSYFSSNSKINVSGFPLLDSFIVNHIYMPVSTENLQLIVVNYTLTNTKFSGYIYIINR